MNNVFIQSFETGQNIDTSSNQIDENENDCLENPFQQISNLRNKNPNNPLISYLNINSLRNKITDLRELVQKIFPRLFCSC